MFDLQTDMLSLILGLSNIPVFKLTVATVKVKINILHIFFKIVIMIIFWVFQFHLLLYHRVVAVIVILYFGFWFDSFFKKKNSSQWAKKWIKCTVNVIISTFASSNGFKLFEKLEKRNVCIKVCKQCFYILGINQEFMWCLIC